MDKVEVGQIWIDNDRRSWGRRMRVIQIEMLAFGEPYALCENVKTQKQTWIKIRRMRPNSTGYRLEK